MATFPLMIVLGYQRTGTTVFGEFLNSHNMIFSLAEVFHHKYAASSAGELGYFSYIQSLPECASYVREPETRTELFSSYLSYLRGVTPRPILSIGVKYDSTHHLDGVWRDILLPPKMFRFLAETGGAIIHCVRSNVFLAELSLLRAFQTNQWHLPEDQSAEIKKVQINVGWLIHKINLHERRRNIFREYISHLNIPVMDVVYEQMFEVNSGAFSQEICLNLATFLGVDNTFWRQPRQKKISPANWRDAITNAREIEEVLRQKGLGVFLG
ncbi:MAG: hypothetical protein IPK78_20995 [Rhodospirillales bacterium]|nr:hypothetical protein [Rhodospirillales bacterium]